MGGVSMTLVEKMIATAFYRGYSLSFDYIKYYDDVDKGITERRKLISISSIKYNDDDEILVCGRIDEDSYDNPTNNYRQFFLDNMSDIQVFKKIDVEEFDS